MAKDQQGLDVAGAPASAAALDRAVTEYLAWKGDPIAVLQEAVGCDPAFTLGASAIASLLLLNGFRGDNPAVTTAIGAAEAAIPGASSREKRHLAAAKAWAAGEIVAATGVWEDILVDHPTDALALRFAHDSYFYLGHSLSIRDSVARVLPAWDRASPNYGFMLGQYAFGLEEAGELRRAEEVGRSAIARNAEDAWAVHAVAHVLETESRQSEGVDFLKASRPSWSKAHALSVHNGWHLALYLIEEGRFDEVLADYDSFVAPRIPGDSLLDLVDASALLWRLELAGADVGARWSPIASQWLTHVDDHVLVFNDLHIALALARASDAQGVARLRRSLDDYQRHGSGDNREITVDIGRRLVDGALAFAQGDYASAVQAILPVRYKVIRIGGSHAQRDLVTQTLIAAAERLAVRPTARTRLAYEKAGGITATH
ncbi:MAG: tetratricopeptide repeat protein [Roseiarcus sp.]|jgi:tetratricopeptide (TPR) repeat protein